MNDIPIMWAAELKAAYPKRSGPTGWASMKLLLACRRALQESTWREILDGCERYKAYCIQSGREGTDFIQNPLRFIEDGCYQEDFTYQAPQTKEEAARAELKARDAERMARAIHAGGLLREPLSPDPGECAAAFETRVRLSATDQPDAVRERERAPAGMGATDSARSSEVRSRITSLVARLKA